MWNLRSMNAFEKLFDRPRVGGDILSYCGRCKMELAHVVVAMIDGRPKRVLCKTCRTEHNHRSASLASATGATRVRLPRQPRTVMLASELWQQKADARKSQPLPYDVCHSYSTGQWIHHPKFGMGVVEEVRMAGKVLVLFHEGEKLLVHSLSNSAK